MSADEEELRARLAALEAEVASDARAHQARKEQALAKVRAERARRAAEQEAVREGQARAVRGSSARRRRDDDDGDDPVTDAVARAAGDRLVKRARAELTRPTKEGEKSWLASGLLSMFFGPLGWLYAGSLREAIPASLAYLVAGAILMKLPMLLLMPVMMVVMPISGIAGAVYAWQYNRNGHRTRLFGKDDEDDDKRLPPGE